MVEWGILLRIAPMPIDLGHLPQLKGLSKVSPPEVHRQSAEARAEVEVALLTVKAQ